MRASLGATRRTVGRSCCTSVWELRDYMQCPTVLLFFSQVYNAMAFSVDKVGFRMWHVSCSLAVHVMRACWCKLFFFAWGLWGKGFGFLCCRQCLLVEAVQSGQLCTTHQLLRRSGTAVLLILGIAVRTRARVILQILV